MSYKYSCNLEILNTLTDKINLHSMVRLKVSTCIHMRIHFDLLKTFSTELDSVVKRVCCPDMKTLVQIFSTYIRAYKMHCHTIVTPGVMVGEREEKLGPLCSILSQASYEDIICVRVLSHTFSHIHALIYTHALISMHLYTLSHTDSKT